MSVTTLKLCGGGDIKLIIVQVHVTVGFTEVITE